MSPTTDAQTTTTTTATTTATTIPNDANRNTNNNNPTIIVRDFAYPDGNASISPTPPSIASTVKPLLSTIAESSHSTKTSSTASIRSDDDSNKLPYTHFYDPSWTLSPDELQSNKAHEVPALNAPNPALLATTTPLSYQPVIVESGARYNIHHPRQSSNSHASHASQTSQYSTYSTYPAQAPMYQLGLGGMGRVPLQILESGVEFDSNPEIGTGEISSIHPDAEAPRVRTGSNTTSNTASSKYSEYSTAPLG